MTCVFSWLKHGGSNGAAAISGGTRRTTEHSVSDMADPGHRFSGWNALSSMCAAAMPGRNEGGRPNLRHGMQGLLLHRITGVRPPLETTYNTEGASESAQTWNSKAWDSYTYRAKAPKLPQFDRDASSRTRTGTKSIEQFNLGPEVTARKQSESSRMQEAHMRTNPSGGSGRSVLNAMIAAASPKKL